jgi:uncharacterized protein YhbP (UPF0306 family)
MEDLKKLAQSILDQGHLMSLGTVDDGGVWVSDVIFVDDGKFNIYWISDPDVRHSQAILKNPKVGATITVSNPREPGVGLQIEGTAEKIEGGNLELEAKHLAKRGKPRPIEAGQILEGDSWYRLIPTKIEIIYEPEFGYEKKKLEL